MRRLSWRVAAAAATLAAALLGAAFVSSADGAAAATGPIVVTETGIVRGAVAATTERFFGIPYAAPPVGELRWTPPQPAQRWQGIRPAVSPPVRCVQPTSQPTSEDCLYLNVHRPRNATLHGRLPVMVYIHGGSLTAGAGHVYDPTRLVERGTIVVTFNYRLGILGFLAHPALAADDGSAGNYGLMDQQAAMAWVERNIDRFGGDPQRVTIFGESAGGLSVLAQLASPGAAGLFSAAISQSGAYNLTLQSLADAKVEGAAYSASVGCADQSATCLRALTPATLLTRQKGVFFLQTDGKVLPRSLGDAFRTGAFNHVPVINGSTHDESTFFTAQAFDLAGRQVTADNYLASIQRMTGVSAATAELVAAQYPLLAYPNPASAVAAAATDFAFACPALRLDGWLASQVSLRAYEFADRNAPQIYLPPVSFSYGAFHASELQYLFDVSNAVYPAPLTTEQQALAATMVRHWATFAQTHTQAQGEWPAFRSDDQTMISYETPQPRPTASFSIDHHCEFWESLT